MITEEDMEHKLNKLLTEEVMDYWLGDATNKQARIKITKAGYLQPAFFNAIFMG